MQIPWRRASVGIGILVLLGVATVLSPETVLPRIHSVLFSSWFPIVLLGLYVLRPFLAWPITALTALVGFRYGVVVGLPIALAGAIGTSLIPYAAGRYFDPEGPILGRFVSGSEHYFRTVGNTRGLIAARFAPTPAEPVSAAAGVGGVSLGSFVIGTAVGEFPWTIAALVVGQSLEAFSISSIHFDWRLAVLGLLAAGLLLAAPVYDTISEGE